MTLRLARTRCGVLLWSAALLSAPAAAQDGTAGASRQRSVLIFAADDLTRPWTRLIVDGARDVIQTAAPDVAVYVEPMDAARFAGPGYADDARAWLRRKYRDTRLDLLLVIGQDVVQFLAEGRGDPWPGVPLFYFESGALTIDISTMLPGATGLVLENVLPSALGIIMNALPGTRRIAIVYGASPSERERFGPFRDTIRRLSPQLEVIDLGGLTMDDLLTRVARLPPDAAILSLTIQVDGAGRTFAPNRPCELVAAAANRPLFTLGSYDFGCGTVGGLLRDWKRAGEAFGRQAIRRLSGEASAMTNLPASDYCRLVFDARQLARWHIPESRLPPGSAVEFRTPSVWRDYRREVIGAVALAALQTSLILGLLFEHRRRRRAEVEARRHLTAMAHLDRRGAMGELATSLAHELNQPLNAILQNAGVAEILLNSRPSPGASAIAETREILADIRKDDLRASDIIRRMRALLQKHELAAGPVDVSSLARDTVALVRFEAASRGIEIDTRMVEPMPPVRGDRVHLQQVLLNLVMNGMDAVAAAPPDRRRVVVEAAARNGHVDVIVKDRGVGLPPGRPLDIFEPFVTSKPNGMGMGLAIARSIVEAHHGQIAAANNPDGGATVWFSIPQDVEHQP
jgi:signal transduction histidine kinase